MSETKNIHQRILAVIADTGAIAKEGEFKGGKAGNFRFHKIDDVVEHLRPHMVKHGVLMVPTVLQHERHEYEHIGYNDTKKRALHSDAVVSCQFFNVDNPEEFITCESFGDGIDFADKSAGKAVSYALKNLLLALFQLRGQPDNEDTAPESGATSKPETKPSSTHNPAVPTWDGKDWKTAIFHPRIKGYEILTGKTLAQVYKADKPFLDWAAKDLTVKGTPTAQDQSLRKALDAYASARDAQQAQPESAADDEPPFD